MTAQHSHDTGRLLIGIGLLTLGLMTVMGLNLLWPVLFILLPGLVMLWIAVAGGKIGAVAMSIPAMIVTGTGALMFVQNLTGYWDSWAYAWTLYGAFLGFAFALMGRRLEEDTLVAVGRWFVYASLAAFAAFGMFFELLLFNGTGPLGPVLLMAAGLYLLTRSERFTAAVDGSHNSKRKVKGKRGEDRLFTGPIVYGSTVRAGSGARVAVVDVVEGSAMDQPET